MAQPRARKNFASKSRTTQLAAVNPVLRVAAILGVSAIGFGLTAPTAAVASEASLSPSAKLEIATFDAERLGALLLKETNRVRKENHQRALRSRPEVKTAAAEQANFMALMLRPTHVNELSGSRSALERVAKTGLERGAVAENVQMLILENLTYEQAAAALVKAWMATDDRINVLESAADYLGCAVRLGRLPTGEETAFAVEVFYRSDRPADSATPKIIVPSAISRSRSGSP
jgi:uncharacterized protein YkwD